MIWLARKVITRRGAIATSTPVFGIAADALALVAQDEAAEAGDLHILALGQRMAHVVQHALDELGRFRAGQSEPVVDDVRQVGAGQRPAQSSLLAHPSDAEVGHLYWFSRPKTPRPPTRHITFA